LHDRVDNLLYRDRRTLMATFNFPQSSDTSSGWSGGLGSDTLGGGTPVSTSTGLSAVPPPDTALLQSITSDIGSLTATAAQNTAGSEAAATQAAGYQKETEAYNTVGAIAAENATVEGVAGNIKQLAANRQVNVTLGSQRAAVASAGFANSGSSLDIMKSSIQQGYLNQQIIQTQTALTQGGFLEEGAAAQAEAAGGQVASNAALSLSQAQAAAGQLATANAANETAAINAYLASTGGVNSPSRALVTSTLTGDANLPTTFSPTGGSTTGGSDAAQGANNALRGGGMGTLSGNVF
jgi:hypothetical protein